ncbi:MAG: response regulator, partial [Alphaproteobacteria bacterium]|nr:response regulator [Alphaproteobacteria bacterium]
VVWTDVYLDPAGHGWMMSAIAPVYRGDFLEGVAGLDVTVGGILDHIGELQVPWNGYAVLVSNDLTIMALPSRGEGDFGLNELTTHSYEEAIRRETLKPEDFNLSRREATQQLAQAITDAPDGVQTVFLGGRSQLVAWTTIEQTGWRLLTVVDEEAVFEKTNELASDYRTLGYWLIVGLVVFYFVFFGFMWRRARQLSQRLLSPIAGISRMMTEIGAGRWRPEPTDSRIRELDEMASHTAAIGEQLERSESDRERAQSRLQLVLESATESIWERSADSTIQVRGRFSKRFSMPTTMQEAAFIDRVHPDDRAAIQTALERVAAGAQDYSVEFRFADGNGRYAWLLSRGKVLERDPESGMVRVMAGTHVDIDALKRVEADLRASSLEAQAASEAKTRFISSMSHELRTPLNAILGFAQLMKLERVASEAESGDIEYLDEILLASQHLSHLVEDILDWSNVQADDRQRELKPLAVRELLQECADMVSAEVQQRDLRLNLDLPGESLQIAADRRRLRQVILNLLSNAMKYNKVGGDITLTYQVAAGHVRLIVEDTGIGIPAEKQDQVFEPFQRLGRENTAILGTGIGLSLCKEFAAHQNGVMGLHSEEGIGSSFWIELPVLDVELAPAADAAAKPVAARAAPGCATVLYVEDNPASQFLVRKALEPMCSIEIEGDGRVALERILANPPELLLLDLNLPGLSGDEVLRQLRQHSQTRDVPVVVLSAAVYEDAGRLSGLEYQALMVKPIDIDELRQLVAEILNEGENHAP